MLVILLAVLSAKFYKNDSKELAAVLERVSVFLGWGVLVGLVIMWGLYFVYAGELAHAQTLGDAPLIDEYSVRVSIIKWTAALLVIL